MIIKYYFQINKKECVLPCYLIIIYYNFKMYSDFYNFILNNIIEICNFLEKKSHTEENFFGTLKSRRCVLYCM